MNFDHRHLAFYNQLILRILSPAAPLDPDLWLRAAISELQQLIPFDSAWWGQVRPAEDGQLAKNCMHGSLGLRPDFAQDWNRLAQCDDFARRSMTQLGSAVVHNSTPEDEADIDPAVLAFCRKHGIHHCLAITLSFQQSGLQFFVCVYRQAERSGFNSAEGFWLEQFGPHLLHGWIQVLQRLYATHSVSKSWREQALASTSGRLVYIGSQLSRLLDSDYQDWQGGVLPKALVPMTRPSAAHATLGSRAQVLSRPCGRFTRISIFDKTESALSPREIKAAWCYAQGQSYKEAARTLGVTPATLRTYLQTAYRHLGVKNKVELLAALERL